MWIITIENLPLLVDSEQVNYIFYLRVSRTMKIQINERDRQPWKQSSSQHYPLFKLTDYVSEKAHALSWSELMENVATRCFRQRTQYGHYNIYSS